MTLSSYKWEWGISCMQWYQANFVFFHTGRTCWDVTSLLLCPVCTFSFPLFTVMLSWRCWVDKYFLFSRSRRRNLSYPAGGLVNKEGIYIYSPLEALFKVHPVADTMQRHSARNGLCRSCLCPCWCSGFPWPRYLLALEVWKKIFWGQ